MLWVLSEEEVIYICAEKNPRHSVLTVTESGHDVSAEISSGKYRVETGKNVTKLMMWDVKRREGGGTSRKSFSIGCFCHLLVT